MVVLANALYFKGDWLDPFDAYNTRDRDFHLLNGKTVRVPLMAKGYTVNFYGSFDDFKLLKLPYDHVQGNKQLSMYVFLPHKKDGLQDLMLKFDSDPSLLTKQYDLRREELEVFLIPKFKFSYAFTASNSMIKLGLTLPFCPKGELTEMVDSPHSDTVFISRLFHKSLIEVDEEGTEAASATISFVDGCAMRIPKPRSSFVADHPFMFMIKDDTSGVVFFTGALLNPK
ncbi:Serpin domain-containing protein [Cephalotus follicularis]|uniref:Serpin domain-containing protein n=1 Tax=Cephalotus follicularis TaxID=3775 RepID=A0A1Q3CBS4_CEPFO|nr:Serpin domain-containing protein [Cephalotus follicularis]